MKIKLSPTRERHFRMSGGSTSCILLTSFLLLFLRADFERTFEAHATDFGAFFASLLASLLLHWPIICPAVVLEMVHRLPIGAPFSRAVAKMTVVKQTPSN